MSQCSSICSTPRWAALGYTVPGRQGTIPFTSAESTIFYHGQQNFCVLVHYSATALINTVICSHLQSGIGRNHRWALPRLVKALPSKEDNPEGLSQVPRAGIPLVNPNWYVPRDRTGMVQIQLGSALQDEQGEWHGRVGGEGCCSCWVTPLTHPTLGLERRQVKHLLCLKVLLLSQSVFQRLVVWGQTRHFGELPFVWKTEGRRTGKHNAGWRNLEKGSSIFIVLYTATLDWCGDLIRCWIMQPFPQTYYHINFGPLNVARLADLRLSL